jgi:hypothetical protein
MLQDAKPVVGVGAGFLLSLSAGQVVEKRGEEDREWKLEEDGTLTGFPLHLLASISPPHSVPD